MAFTSNWEWTGVSRRTDVNVSAGGVRNTRNNWMFTRTRISDVANTPQLGEYAASLAAYAGGTLVTEALGDSELAFMSFDTTTVWTDSTYKYIADFGNLFVGAGGVAQPLYEIDSTETNKPNAAKTTIVKPILSFDTEGATGWNWTWQAAEWTADSDNWLPTAGTPAQVYSHAENVGTTAGSVQFNAFAVSPTAGDHEWSFVWLNTWGSVVQVFKDGEPEGYAYLALTGGTSGVLIIGGGDIAVDFLLADNAAYATFPPTTEAIRKVGVFALPVHATPTNYIETDPVELGYSGLLPWPDPPSVDGLSFVNNFGTFLVDSDATKSTGTGVLYCSQDDKRYSGSVGWHQQTQSWVFKDGYNE